MIKMKDDPENGYYAPGFNLGKDAISDLGLKEMPRLGEKMKIEAIVEATNLNKNNYGGKKDMSIGFMIKEMDIEKKKKSEKEMANSLYGKE